jgi:hypothetical protein
VKVFNRSTEEIGRLQGDMATINKTLNYIKAKMDEPDQSKIIPTKEQ